MKTITISLALVALLAVTAPAFAQDSAAPLPEICTTDAGKMAVDSMPAMPMAHDMDEAHTALMAGMDQTNSKSSDRDSVVFLLCMVTSN